VVCDGLSAAWRIVIGLSLIPAFATLYQRLTLPESTRYIASQKRPDDIETFENLKAVTEEKDTKAVVTTTDSEASDNLPTSDAPEVIVQKKAHFSGKRPMWLFTGSRTATRMRFFHRIFEVFLPVEACQAAHRDVHMLVLPGYCVRLLPALHRLM
jgi:hypothetical protein